MKSVLIRLIILCIVFDGVFCSWEDEWCKFKEDFFKTYKSKKEERQRFRVFKKNIKEINKHNERFDQGFETFKKGVTSFADLSKKQFDKKYGLEQNAIIKVYEDTPKVSKSSESKNVSESLDWRKKGAVTRIKEQGTCGACWIFSATGILEGYNFRKTGQLISLSEQNVVDCFSSRTCEGGFPGDAIMYIKDSGISKEVDYPYKAKQKKCKSYMPKVRIKFEEYEYLNGTEEDLKNALEEHGPIGVSLYVSGNWRLYKSGVWYEKVCSEQTNHAVLLVGYGSENGQDYWLIKNSWGTKWGEDGYIKIARNKHENYCGLTNEAMYIF